MIRRKHDRHCARWPQPHVNLIYPFVPSSEFETAAALLKPVVSKIAPFRIKLRSFKYFVHSKRSATLWLDPETDQPDLLDGVQKELTKVFPFANDLRERFEGKLCGHISVGQFAGEGAALAAQQDFQSKWKEMEFNVERLVFLSREGGTEDRFRVEKVLELGGKASRAVPISKAEGKRTSAWARPSQAPSQSARQRVDADATVSVGETSAAAYERIEPLAVRPAAELTDEELADREALVEKVLVGVPF